MTQFSSTESPYNDNWMLLVLLYHEVIILLRKRVGIDGLSACMRRTVILNNTKLRFSGDQILHNNIFRSLPFMTVTKSCNTNRNDYHDNSVDTDITTDSNYVVCESFPIISISSNKQTL